MSYQLVLVPLYGIMAVPQQQQQQQQPPAVPQQQPPAVLGSAYQAMLRLTDKYRMECAQQKQQRDQRERERHVQAAPGLRRQFAAAAAHHRLRRLLVPVPLPNWRGEQLQKKSQTAPICMLPDDLLGRVLGPLHPVDLAAFAVSHKAGNRAAGLVVKEWGDGTSGELPFRVTFTEGEACKDSDPRVRACLCRIPHA